MALMKCAAAGDAMVFRRLPGPYEGFKQLRDYIAQADFRFFNLETTVHNYEACPAAQSGGSWLCARPEVLRDMKSFGFNITSTANNHALDYGQAGLLKTMEYLRAAELPFAGTGRTLHEASAPVYLDTPGGRFALIALSSTFGAESPAGIQTERMAGRPGLNPLRFTETYRLPAEDLKQLQRIAEKLGVNGYDDILRSEGYLPKLREGEAAFGAMRFREGESAGKETRVFPADLLRTEKSIREARFMADYVVISVHSHEIKGVDKTEPDSFLAEFARACVDAGADAVIGTGPHLLRPLEIYKGKPIFYSLGDFVLQLENVEDAPADLYIKQGLTGNEGLDELFNARSDNGKRGLCYSRVMYEAVVPYWEAENGVLAKLTLLPVELGFGRHRSVSGLPSPQYGAGILERLQKLSEPFGTRIDIENGLGVVRL